MQEPLLSLMPKVSQATKELTTERPDLADASNLSMQLTAKEAQVLADRLVLCFNCLITPGTDALIASGAAKPSGRDGAFGSSSDLSASMAALSIAATGWDFATPLSGVIAEQPSSVLPSLEALTRLAGAAIQRVTHFSAHVFEFDPAPTALKAVDLLAGAEQVLLACSKAGKGGDGIPGLLLEGKSAGAAWLGCMASWNKAAAWVLQALPYSAGFHVLGVAAAQLSALANVDITVTAATCTGLDEGSAAASADAASPQVQDFGALTLPVVMASARALLLVSKVLSLPGDRSKWKRAERTDNGHLLVERALEDHLLLRGNMQDQLANTYPSAFTPAAALECCTRAVQLISRLLPALPPVQLKQKGDASAEGGAAAAAVPPQLAPALLPGVLQKLQQQAADCVAALLDAASALAAASGPGSSNTSHGSSNKLVKLLTALAPPSASNADKPITAQLWSADYGGVQGSSRPEVAKLLQVLAVSVLSNLPSARVCGNPHCVELAKMSERELCVRKCSACKGSATTAYCSKECSHEHWSSHKLLRKRLAGGKQGKAGKAGDDGGGSGSSPAGPATDGAAAATAGQTGGKGGSKKKRTGNVARRAPRPGAILWV